MRATILHLSDIHLRSIEDPVIDRVDAIVSAVKAECPTMEALVVLLSGDAAFSGKREQYQVADLLLTAIADGIRKAFPNIPIDEVHVPGNHDCGFEKHSRVRQLVIDDVLKNNGVDEGDGATLESCLNVQDEYFLFARRRTGEPRTRHGIQRLFWNRKIKIGGFEFTFHCVNTAWMSMLKERQGELVPILGDVLDEGGDVLVTVYHHPYNWLQNDIARPFKRRVEAASDLILTGHEHDPYLTHITSSQGVVSTYIEGGVLQEDSGKLSSFHLVHLDLKAQDFWITTHSWNAGLYERKLLGDRVALNRHQRGSSRDLEFSDDFHKALKSPGAHYRHPIKSPLLLDDFFVPPQLEMNSHRAKGGNAVICSSSEILEDGRSWLLIGEDKCGKSALARYFCSQWHARGKAPLLIEGASLKGATDERKVEKAIAAAIQRAYGGAAYDRFRQQAKEDKVLIIDDLDDAGMNRAQLNNLLALLTAEFGRQVITANLLFPLFQQFQQSDEANSLFSLDLGRFVPFGHALRGKLIEKWYAISKSEQDLDQDHFRRVKEAEDFVKQMLGRSLLPRYPTYVLTLLQLFEGARQDTAVSGSFGYYYERLISESIEGAYQRFSDRRKLPTQDAVRAFLSLVALWMFKKKQTRVSRAFLDEVFEDHKRRHGRLRPEYVLPLVADAELLVEDAAGEFSFSYDYAYFFFLAFYLSENLHREQRSAEVREYVSYIASRLHVDAYSSTLVFLVYLTKDEQTLQTIVEHARGIFSEFKACDLSSDVRAYNELVETPGALELKNRSIPEHLEEVRAITDQQESVELATRFDYSEDESDADLEEVLKLTVAFRTVQALGQILRNSPGSLDVEVKEAATRECFLLNLRTLSFLNRLISENADEFRELYSRYLRSELKIGDHQEIAARTDSYVFAMASLCAYSMIKRTSFAVGSEHLEETYEHVGDLEAPVATALINIAIRLDHFRSFPTTEVRDVGKAVKSAGNWIAFNVLRQLAIDHFVLFGRPFELRASVCSQLDITDSPAFMMRELKA